MFTQCVEAEQANQPNPVEVIALDPGMVDTSMQQHAREKEDSDFAMASFFKRAYDSGQLQTTEQLGQRLLALIGME